MCVYRFSVYALVCRDVYMCMRAASVPVCKVRMQYTVYFTLYTHTCIFRVECQVLSALHSENRISLRFPIGR